MLIASRYNSDVYSKFLSKVSFEYRRFEKDRYIIRCIIFIANYLRSTLLPWIVLTNIGFPIPLPPEVIFVALDLVSTALALPAWYELELLSILTALEDSMYAEDIAEYSNIVLNDYARR